MISVDGAQIEKIECLERKDLEGYDRTKKIRIALQEWLRDNEKYIEAALEEEEEEISSKPTTNSKLEALVAFGCCVNPYSKQLAVAAGG